MAKMEMNEQAREKYLERIEIQRADKGTGARRARFHGSMIDRDLLEKGREFDELPESFVIFITENDKYERGVPLYHIERTIEENDHGFSRMGCI